LISGFSEGDGSFYIRITEGIKYNNISTIYTISQGNKDDSVLQSYKPIMLLIAQLCGTKIGQKGLLAKKNGLENILKIWINNNAKICMSNVKLSTIEG
jgi:hypothetical protein